MKRKSFGHSYYAKLGSDFKVIWCENRLVFKHLTMGSKGLLEELKKSTTTFPYRHVFKSGSVDYCAYITRKPNGQYACEVYKEINENEFSKDEIAEIMDAVGEKTQSSISTVNMIRDYLETSKYNRDYLHDHYAYLKKNMGSVYCISKNIMEIFNDENNAEFIPFQKYLLRTWDIVQYITRKLDKSFAVNIDIFPQYIKVDYSKFELALYNLMKIVLIYSLYEDQPVIKIKSTDFDTISVSVDFTMDMNYEISNHAFEMRAVKYLFRKMNGDFSFYTQGKTMFAKGEIKIESSLDSSLVPPERDIVLIDDPEIVVRKRTSNRYIKIYENATRKGKLEFASEVMDFTDIEDDYVRAARAFFMDICPDEKENIV